MIPFRLEYVIDKTLNEAPCEEQLVNRWHSGVPGWAIGRNPLPEFQCIKSWRTNESAARSKG